MILDLFGDFEYKLKLSQVYAPCYLLSKEGLLESESFFIFLLNCLKSTWTLVRINSYDILVRYPDNFKMFTNKDFVNNIMWQTAMELCNNPKSMMSEGCGLLLKLIFNKCLNSLDFIKSSTQN